MQKDGLGGGLRLQSEVDVSKQQISTSSGPSSSGHDITVEPDAWSGYFPFDEIGSAVGRGTGKGTVFGQECAGLADTSHFGG